jgi:hypothetical protein
MTRWLKPDLFAGLMFMAFAAWGFAASAELDGGSSGEMGPGYFPRLVSGILMALGLGIAVLGVLSPPAAPLGTWKLRPIVMVSLAALAFTLLLQKGGIVLAISTAVLIGVFAGERPKLLPFIALTATLVFASIALFIWGIGIPLPIWPSF